MHLVIYQLVLTIYKFYHIFYGFVSRLLLFDHVEKLERRLKWFSKLLINKFGQLIQHFNLLALFAAMNGQGDPFDVGTHVQQTNHLRFLIVNHNFVHV